MKLASLMLVAAAAAVIGPVDAAGQIVLTVDASDPTAIVFTGTGAPASTNIAGAGFSVGLEGIVLADSTFGGIPSQFIDGGLRPAQGGRVYDLLFVNPETLELRLSGGGQQVQVFDLEGAAFAGSIVVDLSFFDLLQTDTVGDINIFDDFGRPVAESFVGEFSYIAPIPEPASLVALGGLAGAALLRRR